MSFFNPLQLCVLKTSWIPVVLACSIMMIAGYLFPGLQHDIYGNISV